MTDTIRIFDTTLRDGEQAPGFSMTPEAKLRMAKALAALCVAATAGATTLNVPDTVGYTTPEEIYELFRHLGQHVDRDERVIFSTHCHDDLGMAVANSIAAVRGGARQIECAVNGIGERAGNCALEEVVMALRTRVDHYDVATCIDTTRIAAASRTLAQITNTPPPRNKSVVGANAFAHESGIHQHGVLQNRETYEIIKPEDIGLATDGIVLGKHSGRHALAAKAKALGYLLEGERLDQVFAAFKTVADEVGIVDTARLVALLSEAQTHRRQALWTLSKVDIRA